MPGEPVFLMGVVAPATAGFQSHWYSHWRAMVLTILCGASVQIHHETDCSNHY